MTHLWGAWEPKGPQRGHPLYLIFFSNFFFPLPSHFLIPSSSFSLSPSSFSILLSISYLVLSFKTQLSYET